MIELGVCETPNIHQRWEEPLPTLLSWQAAAAINVSHARMDYNVTRLQFFDPAFRLARDGKMRVTANFTIGDLDAASPDAVEAAAYDLVMHYGSDLEAVSFENEPGGKKGMSPDAQVLDISQGGTFDWIRSVYGPLLLAFMRGARRANPRIRFELFDADSTDVQRRCMELLLGTEFENDPNIVWTAHNYADAAGDSSKGDPAGQDYSSMAGMNGKPGFLSVFEDPRFAVTVIHPPTSDEDQHNVGDAFTTKELRNWLISEISKATGPFGGIATPSDMDVMIRYSGMMLPTYPQCRRINFLTAKYFFERVPAPPGVPPGTWCTWTFGEPVVSEKGRVLAAMYGPVDPIRTTMPIPGRKPGQGR